MNRNRILQLALAGVTLCLFTVGSRVFAQNPSQPSAPSQPSGRQLPGAQGAGGSPNSADTMPAKVDDKKFLKDAAIGGMTEVELGKLASEKASNDGVKQFGQRMVDDHTKANDELKQLAAKENVVVPDALDSRHQSRVDKLSKLSGAEFDKAYVKDQLKDHEQDVREFQSEAQNGSDPNVQQFASRTLPTLQQHLEAAKNLVKVTKNEGK